MIAKMMETLKTAGIAKEWHKGDMHRLYIDLAKAADLYYDNNEGFEHGRLNINRRERDNRRERRVRGDRALVGERIQGCDFEAFGGRRKSRSGRVFQRRDDAVNRCDRRKKQRF